MNPNKLFLGTWGLSKAGWHDHIISEAIFDQVLHCAIELGITNIDIAQVYSGISELIDRFPEKRELRITSKVPAIRRFELDTLENVDNYYPNFTESVDNILKNLGTNSIDCILLHNWGRNFSLNGTRLEEEVCQLKADNKIKFFGISLPDEFNQAKYIDNDIVDTVMVPLNYLTEDWARRLIQDNPASTRFIVRSLFVQGLITRNSRIKHYDSEHYLYKRNNIDLLNKLIEVRNNQLNSSDSMSTVVSYYSDILQKDNVNIVFGSSSTKQLKEDFQMFIDLLINK